MAQSDFGGPVRAELAGAVGRLAALNGAVVGLGVISGLVQARGLGPDRRGELASIVVPLVFLGLVADLGLGTYLRRESAQSSSLGPLVGSISVFVIALGVVVAAALFPFVDVLAKDRAVVEKWLQVGLVLLPINLLCTVLLNAALGLGRWELWVWSRLTLAAGWTLILGVLYVTDQLTVGSAAASMAVITVLSYWPLLSVVSIARPLSVDLSIARPAASFAGRAWVASLTNLLNLRLDQLLMVALVDSRELGLYAVAVTIAGMPGVFSNAVGLAILPSVARHGSEAVPRAVRTSLLVVATGGALVAVVTWPAVMWVIGSSYSDAIPVILVLLVAEAPLAGTITLSQAFIGAGRPGQAALAEGAAMVVAFVGLLVAVPALGAIGAALVSLLTYCLSFGYLLAKGRSLLGHPIRSFVVPTGTDLHWCIGELQRVIAAGRARPRRTEVSS